MMILGNAFGNIKTSRLLCISKCFFMSEQYEQADSLQEVKNIRQLMERSSRFISLSGWSGVAAGVFAIIGAVIAKYVLFKDYYFDFNERGYFTAGDFKALKLQLIVLAAGVFAAAFFSAFYFTWKKTNLQGHSLWNSVSRRLFWNMAIPLIAGGFFILGMLQYNEWRFVAPACLVFYGLALVNASKYTLSDIRYLGYCEIIAGLINIQWLGYGIYFWAFGFGVLHIVYGILMWWKYERTPKFKT